MGGFVCADPAAANKRRTRSRPRCFMIRICLAISGLLTTFSANSKTGQRLRLQSECLRVFADDCGGKKSRQVIDVLVLEGSVELVALLGQRTNAALASAWRNECGNVTF